MEAKTTKANSETLQPKETHRVEGAVRKSLATTSVQKSTCAEHLEEKPGRPSPKDIKEPASKIQLR